MYVHFTLSLLHICIDVFSFFLFKLRSDSSSVNENDDDDYVDILVFEIHTLSSMLRYVTV